jgi:cytochrome oxidase assembly protein ShyY1
MLGAHLLALAAVGSAGWLGYWQVDAWQEQRAAESVDLTRLDPEPLDDVMGPDDPFPGDKVGQPVTVTGTWVPDATVFVSGREYEGADGYWVVTPLAVGSPDGPAIPVVRGWSASTEAPAPAAGTTELAAWLQPTEGSGEADDDPSDDVLPQVRTADLIQHVDQDLYGAYAVLDQARTTDAVSAGLEPAALEQLPEVGRFTAVRNLLYAVEWWFFGLFAAFIWWRFVNEQAPVSEDAESPADSSLVGP